MPGEEKYEAVRATEEDLDAFMTDHEELLTAADAFEREQTHSERQRDTHTHTNTHQTHTTQHKHKQKHKHTTQQVLATAH